MAGVFGYNKGPKGKQTFIPRSEQSMANRLRNYYSRYFAKHPGYDVVDEFVPLEQADPSQITTFRDLRKNYRQFLGIDTPKMLGHHGYQPVLSAEAHQQKLENGKLYREGWKEYKNMYMTRRGIPKITKSFNSELLAHYRNIWKIFLNTLKKYELQHGKFTYNEKNDSMIAFLGNESTREIRSLEPLKRVPRRKPKTKGFLSGFKVFGKKRGRKAKITLEEPKYHVISTRGTKKKTTKRKAPKKKTMKKTTKRKTIKRKSRKSLAYRGYTKHRALKKTWVKRETAQKEFMRRHKGEAPVAQLKKEFSKLWKRVKKTGYRGQGEGMIAGEFY